ncbi:hypothetical protein XJ32_00820 [Helicobacter bilis]|uniref:Uncharacterized protein n=1 Tax=Helicobacter bilis TaxID=37372 RepID=A0A1Q2LFL9_9HELI|nr:hypothetical protein [Helicobacter bilis]AQQ58877.1 hypothetical protein XJ32_00820 [Helicobacter bilis]
MLLSEVLKDDDLRLNAEALETIADNYPILLSLQRLDCEVEIQNRKEYSHYGTEQERAEIIQELEKKKESQELDFDFLKDELETLQYHISSTGHALCWYATAEKFYDENEKEISEYFDNLCSECDTSGTDFIQMSVTETLNSPDIAKNRIIEGYLQSLASELMDYEISESDLESQDSKTE